MVRSFAEVAAAVRAAIMVKYPQVSRAFIFGSFADDLQSPDSDLDVMVETRSPMGLAFLSLIQDIEQASGLAVDVITTRQAQELSRKYGYDITQRARLVYERAES